jgi:hypothetical protein
LVVRTSLIIFLMLSLTACGDPLADFERIDDVELAADAPLAKALPDADDVAPTDGLLAGLVKREPVTVTPDSGADVAAESAPVAVVEMPKQGGVAGWLRRVAAAQKTPKALEIVAPLAADAVKEPLNVTLAQVPKSNAEVVRTASRQPEPIENEKPSVLAEPQKRRGLFPNLTSEKTRKGPDARDVPVGTILPFGKVARVCEAKDQGALGHLLDRSTATGRGHKLFDSAPQSVGARTFYVTGFKDNCPRQFTASLALFGSAEVQKQLRYGLPSKSYPYSTTDKAYDKVKSAVCGVGKNQPCGARPMSKLTRNTVFISTYERFSSNARWADILLHDGAVAAAAIKTP